MNTNDLISRATHTSGRTLLVVSSIVLFANHYELDLTDFPIIQTASDTLKPDMVEFAAKVLVLYLAFAHMLNWSVDKTGYVLGELYKLTVQEERLRKKQSEIHDGGSGEQERDPYPYELLVQEMHKRIALTSFLQYVALYIQHLFIPIAAGSLAIYSLW